jgi:hypothetical protein
MDVESGEERIKAVLNEINGRNLERPSDMAGPQLKRRWGCWQPPRPSVFVCRN